MLKPLRVKNRQACETWNKELMLLLYQLVKKTLR